MAESNLGVEEWEETLRSADLPTLLRTVIECAMAIAEEKQFNSFTSNQALKAQACLDEIIDRCEERGVEH